MKYPKICVYMLLDGKIAFDAAKFVGLFAAKGYVFQGQPADKAEQYNQDFIEALEKSLAVVPPQ